MARDRGGNRQVIQAVKEHFDLVSYMERQGYAFKRVGNELYAQGFGGLCVNPVIQKFYYHKEGVGGDLIDFVAWHDRISTGEAISRLRLEMGGVPATHTPIRYGAFTAGAPKKLSLPEPAAGQFRRVFAYLSQKRGIDPEVIRDLFQRRMLYEDAKHHNCVFVGYQDKQPVYASLRSTGEKKWVMDLPGSRKAGWFVNNQSPALLVAEAPIDAMSLMTLMKLGGRNYRKYSYLAQGGCGSISALEQCVKGNPHISRVYICFDNDEAGRSWTGKARELLGRIGFTGAVIDKCPRHNDFNDDLRAALASGDGYQVPQPAPPANLQEVSICAL